MIELLKITKWEPPIEFNDGQSESQHSLFNKYTDIQNLRNYLNIFTTDEDVRITEKCHGQNLRIGWVENELIVGSHNLQKRNTENSRWWATVTKYPQIKDMLMHISNLHNQANVILYGELIGSQDLKYNLKNGELDFRGFDISVNGLYLNYDDFITYTTQYNIPTVPLLYKGKFNLDIVKSFEGKSFIADHLIEGVVITPLVERRDYKIGRVVLKYVYDSYLHRKNGTEFH